MKTESTHSKIDESGSRPLSRRETTKINKSHTNDRLLNCNIQTLN